MFDCFRGDITAMAGLSEIPRTSKTFRPYHLRDLSPMIFVPFVPSPRWRLHLRCDALMFVRSSSRSGRMWTGMIWSGSYESGVEEGGTK